MGSTLSADPVARFKPTLILIPICRIWQLLQRKALEKISVAGTFHVPSATCYGTWNVPATFLRSNLPVSVDLDVDFLRFLSPFHDESKSGRSCVAAHEIVHDSVGLQMVIDLNFEQSARCRIESRLPKILGHHFSQPFESGNLRFAAFGVRCQDSFSIAFIRRPITILADVDSEQRRNLK